ncbi:MAG: M24 family metallopeptidase [Bacteroidota bacterium]
MILAQIRRLMRQEALDAYVIPMGDPHHNEYLAPHWQLIKAVSGFSGSAGVLLITQDFAGLWTDARYFGQAEYEIEAYGLELVRLQVPHQPEYIDWLEQHLTRAARIGGDLALFSIQAWQSLHARLEAASLELVPLDEFWTHYWLDRPAKSSAEIFVHPDKYVGEKRSAKLHKLKTALQKSPANACLLTALDEIAWLLNLRGADIPYNPIFFSFFWLSAERSVLFVELAKIGEELKETLRIAGVECLPYTAIHEYVAEQREPLIWSDPRSLNAALYGTLAPQNWLLNPSYIRTAKANKHPEECALIRARHDKEGLVWLYAWQWWEQQLQENAVGELDLVNYMESLRAEEEVYLGPSFSPIVAYGPNGAMNHYSPSKENQAMIEQGSLLLVDTGGQYLDGTTDMTRTFATGTPTESQRKAYTAVLQGLIALSRLRFPAGTAGQQLDSLARAALWQEGLNYGHGTGHGVGYCLNVHEGPQAIGTGASGDKAARLEQGMLTSVEPGYYLEGQWGIRVENLLLCVEDEKAGWLKFESLGYCPLEVKLIVWEQLKDAEWEWVRDFQKSVYRGYEKRILPHLKPWLQEKTFAK